MIELNFDENIYRKYLDAWLNGIDSELVYWEYYIKFLNKPGFENWGILNDKQFEFDEYVESPKTVFIDIGSGPFSSVGFRTTKTELEFHAVDPLAFIYKGLKEKYKITTKITPEFGLVEKLTEKYGINKFDIVHMSNALDHSFNPIIGIYQMISLCKIGGKIILQHYENEAEYEKYCGFHQWNLCIVGSDFIIWKPEKKYNITKMFEEYVDSTAYYAEGNKTEGKIINDKSGRKAFKVIMTKKKNIPIGVDNYIVPDQNLSSSILDEKIFEELSKIILQKYFYEKNKLKNKIYILFYGTATRIKRDGIAIAFKYYINKFFNNKTNIHITMPGMK
ncbi:hypothetical protein AGMMS49546_34540 [Spirochaetia bacterium]|nr:hypothetical protein AGMMS49546_34540 [Spirochaetia bacterium]